jgi:hypothetical protein
MDFVKKHYEKILLGFVLLGLVGALVFLPFMIANDQDNLRRYKEGIIHGKVTPLPAVDLAQDAKALEQVQSPYKLDFSTTNKLFNSVPWLRKADGTLIKGSQADVSAAVVTKITPLYLVLTLDSIETNDLGARYAISMERQAAALPAQRVKKQHYVSVGEPVGEKNNGFVIKAVSGSPADPKTMKLVLQLMDTGESATLTKDKPFQRVDGYTADLKYEIDKPAKTWSGQRVGAVLKFAGDDYIIVAIDQGAVILKARSNDKKTPLSYNPQNSE